MVWITCTVRMPNVSACACFFKAFVKFTVAIVTISFQCDALPSADFNLLFFTYWRQHHHREHRVVPTARRRVVQPQRARERRVMRNCRGVEDDGRVAFPKGNREIRVHLPVRRQHRRTIHRIPGRMHHTGVKHDFPIVKMSICVVICAKINNF